MILGQDHVVQSERGQVNVGGRVVKLLAPYEGPALPPETCPFRYQRADHRGMSPWERVLYERAKAKIGEPILWGSVSAGQAIAKQLLEALDEGKIPFATCRNPLDGNRRWGRYWVKATGTVITKRVPPKKKGRFEKLVDAATDLVDDVADWVTEVVKTFEGIGAALLDQFKNVVASTRKFIDTVIEAFKMGICAMVDDEWKRRLLQAGAIFAGLPPSGTDLALKICRALCALLAIIETEASASVKAISSLITVGGILL